MGSTETKLSAREQFIADLHRLADFLHANPDIPIGAYPNVSLAYYPDGNDAEKLAEVERVAAMLGVEVTENRTQRKAKIAFGRVDYHATFISSQDHQDWRELMEIGEQRKAERAS